jgi:AraC family transcriptional regulator of adaptative response / DNA-3-methyladenine glycosylase II
MPGARARALLAVARAIEDGAVDLAGPPEDAIAALLALPGIGPWTAQYIAMRALSWPDAFPAGDLGVKIALGGLDAREATERAEAWRPWRAYAVMHLWASLSAGKETKR